MPRDNSSKRMFADNQNKYDALMWERRYNTCVDSKEKLYQDLDECVDLLDRILLHVDIGYTNPSMETEIKEFLKKIR